MGCQKSLYFVRSTSGPHLITTFLQPLSKCRSVNDTFGICCYYRRLLIDNLTYAEYNAILANSSQEFQAQSNKHYDATKPFGMETNVSKTKDIVTKRHELDNPPVITVSGRQVGTVNHLLYLGGLLSSDSYHSSDLNRRLTLASSSCRKLANLWKKHLLNKLKMRLFDRIVIPIVIYGCETLTLKTEDETKTSSFRDEMSQLHW